MAVEQDFDPGEAAGYDASVFINCPFDDGYLPPLPGDGVRHLRLRLRPGRCALPASMIPGRCVSEKIMRCGSLLAGASTISRAPELDAVNQLPQSQHAACSVSASSSAPSASAPASHKA